MTCGFIVAIEVLMSADKHITDRIQYKVEIVKRR